MSRNVSSFREVVLLSLFKGAQNNLIPLKLPIMINDHSPMEFYFGLLQAAVLSMLVTGSKALLEAGRLFI